MKRLFKPLWLAYWYQWDGWWQVKASFADWLGAINPHPEEQANHALWFWDHLGKPLDVKEYEFLWEQDWEAGR